MNATFGIAICEEIVPYGAVWPLFVRLVVISIAEKRKSFLRAGRFSWASCAFAWGQELSRMGSACRFAVAFFDAGRGASAVNRARRFERTSWDLRSEARLRREPSERLRAGAGAGFDAPRIWHRSLAPALAVGLCLSIWVWRFRLCRARRGGFVNLSLFCVGLDRRRFRLVRGGGCQKAE